MAKKAIAKTANQALDPPAHRQKLIASNSENHSAPKSARMSRLEALRRKLTPQQRHLLNTLWAYHEKNSNWPATRLVHSQQGGKDHVRDALRTLTSDIVFEMKDQQGSNCYEMTLIGGLLTQAGETYRTLLIKYLEFLRRKYYEEPEKLTFSDDDFRHALNLNDCQLGTLGKLVTKGNLTAGASCGTGSWRIHAPAEIEDLPREGELDNALETLLFRHFKAVAPVFLEDRYKINARRMSSAGATPFGQLEDAAMPTAVDALKRRYQVFVSSTYEDLKEERQHVIQALLETKCIPTGMELFPAASMEQWELIKKVIEECDYYIVVVAGRYGSLNELGVSYTETEFDYALEIGKPVIGFYHKNCDDLPASKSEKSDEGRAKLKAFTEKVKRRVCRPWTLAAELGSAVKSAIIHELEFNPKAGWIRGDAVPSSEAVERLKQRIADLEEKLKKRETVNKAELPDGAQVVQLPVTVEYDVRKRKDPEGPYFLDVADKSLEREIDMSWDEILQVLARDLETGVAPDQISRTLESELHDKLHGFMCELLRNKNPRYEVVVSSSKVESILKTLMARKLIKIKPSYGSYSYNYAKWQFTPKGLQYLSGLQAIRSRV